MKRTIDKLVVAVITGCLTFLFSSPVYSQSDYGENWNIDASAGVTFSQMYGDLKDANRQYASDQGTLFGQSTSYETKWQPSWAIDVSATRWLVSSFGVSGGMAFSSYRFKEEMTISYEPAYFGVTQKIESVTNTMRYLSPRLALSGRWKGFQVNAGISANIFLTGNTVWENTLQMGTTDSEAEIKEVGLDIQDQPIYPDESAIGGYVDYTSIAPMNHGANTVWFSSNVGASYALFDDKPSPFIAFNWQFPLQELIRSRNPSYSIRNGITTPVEDDLNQGTRIKSFSASIGFRF